MQQLKKKLPTILLVLVFLTGVGLLLYPTFSDWWNSEWDEAVLEL